MNCTATLTSTRCRPIWKECHKDAIEFAVAASCLKHSIEGDFNRVTVSDTKRDEFYLDAINSILLSLN